MANAETLKKYLVGNGEKSYLLNSDNNGKTIMLSGKWGSGKTHFWKNDIATDDLKDKLKKEKKAYAYVSLYGKTTLEEIETDLFMQTYNSVVGDADFISKTCSVFTKIGEKIAPDGLSSSFKGAQKLVDDDKTKKGSKYLFDGGLICFDDFERKSKDIDLNDLFGFISQLTIEFNCKVVIILNDDVFEGEEKKIFSNVKEKTVSKYLFYSPTIKELFDLIYESNEIYKNLDEYKDNIVKTIQETKVLNARIYIQVLDNLCEWKKNKESNDNIMITIVLASINFILYHTTVKVVPVPRKSTEEMYTINSFEDKLNSYQSVFSSVSMEKYTLDNYINGLSSKVYRNTDWVVGQIQEYIDFLNENIRNYHSIYFANKHDISRGLNNSFLQKINNFIETGILLEEH